MLRDLFRLLLIWGLFIAVFVLVGKFASAEETTKHLNGTFVRFTGPTDENGLPIVEIEDFRDLPHDYAKRLPPELYYWWALAHNERQAARAPAPAHGVLRIDENHSIIGSAPTYDRFGNRGNGRFNANSQRSTTTRYFPPQTGSGPAIIYNPYFR